MPSFEPNGLGHDMYTHSYIELIGPNKQFKIKPNIQNEKHGRMISIYVQE